MLTKKQIDEIGTLYRGAKNKQKEIGILAQLYSCDKAEVRKALGLENPGRKATDEWGITIEDKKKFKKVGDFKKKPEKPANNLTEESKEKQNTISSSLQALLDRFDDNEKKMRELIKKMVPLAAEYKDLELRQQNLAKFIEDFCRINEKQTT